MAARDQPLLLRSILFRIADSTQQCPFIDEEGAESYNDQTFEIAGRDSPPLRMVLGRPRDQ